MKLLIPAYVGLWMAMPLVDAQAVAQIVLPSTRQTIDGFGFSIAFMAQYIQALPATPRSKILDLLLSPSVGAGFSIVRVKISPGTSNTAGVYDYTTDVEEIGNRWFLGQATARGVSRFLATAWTPPVYLKTNNAENGGSVKSDAASLQAYANFLSNYTRTYRSKYGINYYAISPQNEPELAESYQSCQWTPANFVSFLGSYLRPTFLADGVSTRVLAAESNLWDESMIRPTLQDSTASAGVQIVAAHPYLANQIASDGSGITISGYDVFPWAAKKAKQIWATEFSNLSSTSDSITESVRVATLVHKQLTVPQSNAFLFWWGASHNPDSDGNTAESLIFFTSDGTYTVRKRLYALGQFARFIRPGWVRLDATAEPALGVHVTAFKSNTSQIAIVAINQNSAATSIKFNLHSINVSTMDHHRTSASENLASLPPISVSGGTFTVALAALSINTFNSTSTGSAGFPHPPSFISEMVTLADTSGASGDLTNKFFINTIDPSRASPDETALCRQTNTNEWIQYILGSATFIQFKLTVLCNGPSDGLTFSAVSASGILTSISATKSASTTLPGFWFGYSYTITTLPAGTKHIRINFSPTNAEWNPKLQRLVITYN